MIIAIEWDSRLRHLALYEIQVDPLSLDSIHLRHKVL